MPLMMQRYSYRNAQHKPQLGRIPAYAGMTKVPNSNNTSEVSKGRRKTPRYSIEYCFRTALSVSSTKVRNGDGHSHWQLSMWRGSV